MIVNENGKNNTPVKQEAPAAPAKKPKKDGK